MQPVGENAGLSSKPSNSIVESHKDSLIPRTIVKGILSVVSLLFFALKTFFTTKRPKATRPRAKERFSGTSVR